MALIDKYLSLGPERLVRSLPVTRTLCKHGADLKTTSRWAVRDVDKYIRDDRRCFLLVSGLGASDRNDRNVCRGWEDGKIDC